MLPKINIISGFVPLAKNTEAAYEFIEGEVYLTAEVDAHIGTRVWADGNVTNGIVSPVTHIGSNPSTIEDSDVLRGGIPWCLLDCENDDDASQAVVLVAPKGSGKTHELQE
jgi:hypothetical protein